MRKELSVNGLRLLKVMAGKYLSLKDGLCMRSFVITVEMRGENGYSC